MEVSLTSSIRSSLGLVLEKKDKVSNHNITKFKIDSTTIPFSLVQTVSICLQELYESNDLPVGSPVWAHELIKGSQVIVPSLEAKVDTPEVIEKRKKLEAYVSNLRYRKMVQNISTTPEHELLIAKAEMADFKTQAGMDIVFGMLVALLIGWYVGKRIFHGDVGGIILGLVFMIGALVVETSLFTIRLSEVDMKKEKQTKKELERDAKERINGGYPNYVKSHPYNNMNSLIPNRFNMTPHLLKLPNAKAQSYSLEGTESNSFPSKSVLAIPTNTDIVVATLTDEAQPEIMDNLTKTNKKKGK